MGAGGAAAAGAGAEDLGDREGADEDRGPSKLRLLGSEEGSKPSTTTFSNSRLMSRSTSDSTLPCSVVTNEIALPDAPIRAVLPTRWT